MRLRNLFWVCRDLEGSRRFYETLGLTLVREGRRSAVYDLGGPQLHLHAPLDPEEVALYGLSPGPGDRSSVLCLEVEDLEGVAARLGPAVRLGPREAPWGGRMLLLEDPEGRVLELAGP